MRLFYKLLVFCNKLQNEYLFIHTYNTKKAQYKQRIPVIRTCVSNFIFSKFTRKFELEICG